MRRCIYRCYRMRVKRNNEILSLHNDGTNDPCPTAFCAHFVSSHVTRTNSPTNYRFHSILIHGYQECNFKRDQYVCTSEFYYESKIVSFVCFITLAQFYSVRISVICMPNNNHDALEMLLAKYVCYEI